MKEIGGYLELESLISKPYHKDCICLNSGRAALKYLLINKNIKKIYLPFYLCESVYNYINVAPLEIEFYHIDINFHPILISPEPEAYIYIVNHYGVLTNSSLLRLKEKFKNVIIDNTHSFFLEPLKGVNTIYSCRKFFGVPDGAYLYSNIENNLELEDNKITKHLSHIIGRKEYSASAFYEQYVNNDKYFERSPIKNMSFFTKTILGAIDYDNVKNKRATNFAHLRKHLDKFNLMHDILLGSISDGPFCYPFLVEDAILLRNKLINHNIYIPFLWPNVKTTNGANDIESNLSKNILPIPCDQRYNMSDMDIIINIIKDEKLI